MVLPKGEGCCGALVHHMGREHDALAFARANIDAWMAEVEGEGLDAILITASGCGTTIKDYGFMFRNEPAYADKAARVSAALAENASAAPASASAVEWFAAQRRFSTVPAIRVSEFSAPSRRSQEKSSGER